MVDVMSLVDTSSRCWGLPPLPGLALPLPVENRRLTAGQGCPYRSSSSHLFTAATRLMTADARVVVWATLTSVDEKAWEAWTGAIVL